VMRKKEEVCDESSRFNTRQLVFVSPQVTACPAEHHLSLTVNVELNPFPRHVNMSTCQYVYTAMSIKVNNKSKR
jgi:hypothetical protein